MHTRKSRFLLAALLADVFMGGLFTSCGGNRAAGRDVAWDQVPAILARIVPPTFPARDFYVGEYGAVGNGVTDCQAAVFNEAAPKIRLPRAVESLSPAMAVGL